MQYHLHITPLSITLSRRFKVHLTSLQLFIYNKSKSECKFRIIRLLFSTVYWFLFLSFNSPCLLLSFFFFFRCFILSFSSIFFVFTSCRPLVLPLLHRPLYLFLSFYLFWFFVFSSSSFIVNVDVFLKSLFAVLSSPLIHLFPLDYSS